MAENRMRKSSMRASLALLLLTALMLAPYSGTSSSEENSSYVEDTPQLPDGLWLRLSLFDVWNVSESKALFPELLLRIVSADMLPENAQSHLLPRLYAGGVNYAGDYLYIQAWTGYSAILQSLIRCCTNVFGLLRPPQGFV